MTPSADLADRLAAALARAGTSTLFGVPGGGPNLDLVGAAEANGIRFVLAHGETAAAIMASTNGLVSGRPSAAVVTRGPGAASLANGAAQATLDRHPLVVLADTVPTASRDRVAHQRIDQRALMAPITKRSVTVGPAADDERLDELLAEATIWPPGAIHLDIDATSPEPLPGPGASGRRPTTVDREAIAEAERLLDRADRPVVIVGAEAASIAATDRRLRAVLDRFGAPVLTTYQGVGTVPSEGPLNAGLFTNGALERPVLDAADLVVTVGLDLVEPIPAPWQVDAPTIRLSSVQQTDDYLTPTVDLVGPWPSLLDVLDADRALAWSAGDAARFRSESRAALDHHVEAPAIGPIELVDTVAALAPTGATVTVDAGAHFLAVMPRWPVAEPHHLLISNGLATMGYAVPAAIGAALARPGQPVVALTGDGGLSMVLAELETIARLELPITVVVFNDSALSLIAIKQGPANGGPDAVEYRPTDFAVMAAASGLVGQTVTTVAELTGACDRDWTRPGLIDARVDPGPYHRLIAATRG